jgi:hypothetical protein
MNTPPPIPPVPPIIRQRPPTASFASQAATVSIAAPFVGIAVNVFNQSAVRGNPVGMMIVGGTAILLILSGFVLGLVALVQTKRYGGQGILGRAIVGVCINGLLIALMLIGIPGFLKAAERAKERQRQQQQQP